MNCKIIQNSLLPQAIRFINTAVSMCQNNIRYDRQKTIKIDEFVIQRERETD